MDDLSIIIVSWNCRERLAQCLRSIESSNTRHSYRVFVVDNGSTDGTLELLEQDHRSVNLISNGANLGFAAANNRALRVARSRYALLLNPDTIVHPGAIDAMMDFFEQHDDAWALGPSMLNGDGTAQRTGVTFPSIWDLIVESLFLDRLFPGSRLFGKHKEMYEDPGKARTVDYVQGACLMVSASAMEKIGVLDEQFFMYFEEADWCYRMKQAGGKVYLCPGATVTHFGAGEIGHFDERRLVYYHKSILYFYRKYHPGVQLLILRAILFVRSLIRMPIWFAVGVARPSLLKTAKSSLKGYVRTLGLLFREV